MNSRCGLDGCDCEYTIGGLLRRLELIEEALEAIFRRATPRSQDYLHPTKEFADDIARMARAAVEQANLTVKQTRAAPGPCAHTQSIKCDSSCPCQQEGYEAERRPLGS